MDEFELAIQGTSKCLRWPAVATYNTNTNTNTNTDTRLALSCPWLSLSASAPRILGVGAAQTWPAASEPRKAKGRKDRDADRQTQRIRGRKEERQEAETAKMPFNLYSRRTSQTRHSRRRFVLPFSSIASPPSKSITTSNT